MHEIDDGQMTCGGGIAATDMMRDLIGRLHGQVPAIIVADMCIPARAKKGRDKPGLKSNREVKEARVAPVAAFANSHRDRFLTKQAKFVNESAYPVSRQCMAKVSY